MTNLKTGARKKQSTPNFPKNEHFLPSDTHTQNFSKNLAFCFLLTPMLRFALLPYYRQIGSM